MKKMLLFIGMGMIYLHAYTQSELTVGMSFSTEGVMATESQKTTFSAYYSIAPTVSLYTDIQTIHRIGFNLLNNTGELINSYLLNESLWLKSNLLFPIGSINNTVLKLGFEKIALPLDNVQMTFSGTIGSDFKNGLQLGFGISVIPQTNSLIPKRRAPDPKTRL